MTPPGAPLQRLIAKSLTAAGIVQAGRGLYPLGRKADKLSPPTLL